MGGDSSKTRGKRRKSSASRLLRGSSGLEFSPRSRGRPGRSRRLRFRRALLCIVVLLSIVLAAECAVALFTSHRFALREVKVEGVSESALPLVLKHAPSPGPNLFSLPGRQIASKIQALSFVEEVDLKRRPFGTLIIRVKERRPIAYLKQKGQTVFVDGAGIAFLLQETIPGGIPELSGIEISAESIGRPISGTKATALCKGLAALTKNSTIKAKRLVVDERGWLTAHLVSGTELRLGPAQQLEEKLRVVEAVLASSGASRPAEYFDVSVLEAAVWKPR
ncbi:MAG: FtsQ-type POTRA domain-containing protein [Armatimonadetes bacterium]|nr:FtsQ-type POTRA domain-containing protein [Armatimonadota bacterium]NIM24713.1 FtsQ-type POTRA domain-containing protein [Armatimonadota bacterium]NIM68593.1 FtsQ-type POTRA domain-containing protein [Armatimonadota bacterium]NIM77110.1 FtsQ-type POTRA domain-containing protein [Armatimonadota bacterium]NIN06787.1 FtsQ-type POTRA domain-containing protein [Armatimonadota bacterium]